LGWAVRPYSQIVTRGNTPNTGSLTLGRVPHYLFVQFIPTRSDAIPEVLRRFGAGGGSHPLDQIRVLGLVK
jgi:hypothetical protein